MRLRWFHILAWVAVLGLAAPPLAAEGVPLAPAAAQTRSGTLLPRPDHIVVVVEENKSFSQIVGNPEAPYINSLARRGALFTHSFGVGHPSQPNYLALFSGSTQGVTDDSCPQACTGETLAGELFRTGRSFGSYAESMPSAGYTGCSHDGYARKHNPYVNWQGRGLPASANMPLASFPDQYARLPTVSFVIPDMEHDMHDGTIGMGDAWLAEHLGSYVQWAALHNSLLILTWDEGPRTGDNRIPTIFVGPMVRRGVYSRRIDHYDVLRTIGDMYGLGSLGKSGAATPIVEVWNPPGASRHAPR